MSEQSQILTQMQELIMNILKTGTATPQEAEKLDSLEEALYKQKCFEKAQIDEHDFLGEEIATLFSVNKYDRAIEKMIENKITPEDFFGFAEYHFEDEEDTEMFTQEFIIGVNKEYLSRVS